MNQTLLALDTRDFGTPDSVEDRIGFDIGWDHAHHGLVPPAELLLEGTPLGQGWRAGKAVFGSRTLAALRSTRQWLVLRTLAWRRGIAFETQQLTPHYLAQIHTEHCPVLRLPLGGSADHAAVVERLNPDAGYAAGNLATVSQAAAQAREGVDLQQALRLAQSSAAAAEPVGGLDAAAWTRLAVLRSFATKLPFFEAARLPLAVLPPNRVRLLNPAQGLQALLTLQFATPGFSARARSVAELLPAHTRRHDFNLFVGALAPRVLEATANAASPRLALEDAWLNERVQRRWQHFVLSLGEAGTDALLGRCAARGLAGVRTLQHAPEEATEGWALAQGGRVRPPEPMRLRHLAQSPSGGGGSPPPGGDLSATPTAPSAARRETAPPPRVPASRGSARHPLSAR